MSCIQISLEEDNINLTDTTQVFWGENMQRELPKLCKNILSDGHICVSYFEDVQDIATVVSKNFEESGYRVSKVCFAPNTKNCCDARADLAAIAEDVRLFISVGSGALCDIVKLVATERLVPYVVFATAASTDSYFHNFVSELSTNGIVVAEAAIPRIVVFDKNIECPKQMIAGGYGVLYSKLVSLAELQFRQKTDLLYIKNAVKIVEDAQCREICNLIEGALIAEGSAEMHREQLLIALIKVGLWGQKLGILKELEGQTVVVAKLIAAEIGDDEFCEGVYKFIAATSLFSLYKGCLKVELADLCVPPSIAEEVSFLEENFGVSRETYMRKIWDNQYFSAKKYKLQNFLLGEFREDIFATIETYSKKTSIYAREFRRIFSDAGYCLRHIADGKKILSLIKASSFLYSEGMLSHFCVAGFLEGVAS